MNKNKISEITSKPYMIVVLLLAAIAFRLVILSLFLSDHLSSNATLAFLPFADALLEGKSIIEASHSLASFTPPLYAAFVGLVFFIFGKSFIALYIIQIIIDALVCLILFKIGKEVFNIVAGIISGFIYCFYPLAAIVTTSVGDEVLFTFFFCLFVLFVIKTIKIPTRMNFAICGFILALATLTRSTTQAFPVIFILFFLFAHGLTRKNTVNLLLFLFSFFILVIPWTIRNYSVYGALIPVALNGTPILHGSDQRFFLSEDREEEMEKYFVEIEARGLFRPEKPTDAEGILIMDRYVIRAGLENYKIKWENSPIELVKYILDKFRLLWYNTESGNNAGKILIINLIIYPLAFLGLAMSFSYKNFRIRMFLYILILYFILLHLIPVPLFRYLLPIMPIFILFESYFIEKVLGLIFGTEL